MSTLIIHPKDHSTDFLKPIYAPIKDKTVIRGGIRKTDLMKLIEDHERIIMLGHGSPRGLLSVGQFFMAGNYIVDWTMVDLLSYKSDNIYIWCHADLFVQSHELKGFCSGMFISEVSEAFYCGLKSCTQKVIDESNFLFAEIVSQNINKPLNAIYENVIQEYTILSETNLIAKFNLERLCLNVSTLNYDSLFSRYSLNYIK